MLPTSTEEFSESQAVNGRIDRVARLVPTLCVGTDCTTALRSFVGGDSVRGAAWLRVGQEHDC